MRGKNKGFILGALLLIFFTVYTFRDEFYKSILENYTSLSAGIVSWIPKVVTIIIIILFAKLIISFVNSLLERYFKYVGKEKEYYSVSSIVKYVVWILSILGILSVIIGNLGVWLTSVGLIGFGITFALQKPILNFVGWLTIIFSKTYSLGDRIKVGDDKGDVIEIQMMSTVIDGLLEDSDELSGKIITLPNAQVLTSPIINFTKSGEYIWDGLSVDITYESNWKKAEEILKDVTFKVVNKYVSVSKDDHSEKHEHIIETLGILKKHHGETENVAEKQIIEKRMGEIQEERKRLEGIKKFAFKDIKKEPSVRVSLRDSSVGLSVRYLAHYRSLRMMKSEINVAFLHRVARTKKVEIAYPHLQIVRKGKT